MNEKNKNFKSNGSSKNRGASDRKGQSRKKDKSFKSKEARFDAEANRGQTKASNDPSWYGADSPLMHNAANLSFAQMAGMPFDWGDCPNFIDPAVGSKSQLPGIAVMEYLPMPGILNDWTAPFNVAIRDIYSWIRKSQSGAKNYNAADLGHYIMAYDGALIVYAWMVRVYGMLRMVVQRNRYTPKAILRTLGVDYDDLVRNASTLRFYINSFASRLNAMKVPNTFDFFKRHMWLTSNVYADAPVQTAQLVIANPSHIWKLDVDAGGAGLVPVRLGHVGTSDNEAGWNRLDDPWGYDDIVSFAESIINTLLNNEDFNIMSGDILKAYDGNVFSLSFIGEDYVLNPVFDPEFNLQFHNASFMVVDDILIREFSIHEDTAETTNVGALVTNIMCMSKPHHASAFTTGEYEKCASNTYLAMKKVIDIPFESPTAKDVAIATRFAISATIDPAADLSPTEAIVPHAYGTEIPTRLTMYHLNNVTGAPAIADVLNGYMHSHLMDEYTKLANAPILPVFTYTTGSEGATYTYVVGDNTKVSNVAWVGDFDNFAMVNDGTLFNIHTAALFGLYGLVK